MMIKILLFWWSNGNNKSCKWRFTLWVTKQHCLEKLNHWEGLQRLVCSELCFVSGREHNCWLPIKRPILFLNLYNYWNVLIHVIAYFIKLMWYQKFLQAFYSLDMLQILKFYDLYLIANIIISVFDRAYRKPPKWTGFHTIWKWTIGKWSSKASAET